MTTRSALGIRETLLLVVHDMEPKSPIGGSLQQGPVLNEVAKRLEIGYDADLELAVLTIWNDLFRTGYLSWGHNLNNPNPPFFHISGRGRLALERLSRDPGNPAGYTAHLYSIASLNPVANSYLNEGLACFVEGLHKSASVMLGAAAESIILEVRDVAVNRLNTLGAHVPKGLLDWRVKTVMDSLGQTLFSRISQMPHDLRVEYESYWPAFSQQIRAARNDAGHPTSIDPVSPDAVHATFLVFPELARTATRLVEWIPSIN